tara:strand:- start:60 stop:392 length:333 start_codon:yes stop_codon:yes gene_type:complete
MENSKPTPMKKFTFNISNYDNPVTIRERFFSKGTLFRVGKSILKLEIAIILTIIINILLNKTKLYRNYIKNIKPSIIKIGPIKIKTRKLIAMLIKYLILVLVFSIITFLI